MERERDEALLLGWRGSGAFAGSLPGDEVRSIWQRRALVHAYRHHCPPNHRTVGNVALAVRGGGGSQALTHRMTRRPTSCPAHMCSRGHRRELRCLAGWLVGCLVAYLVACLLACCCCCCCCCCFACFLACATVPRTRFTDGASLYPNWPSTFHSEIRFFLLRKK